MVLHFHAPQLMACAEMAQALREQGAEVSGALENDPGDGALTLLALPRPGGGMDHHYQVYNFEVYDVPQPGPPALRSTTWTPRVSCGQKQSLCANFNWTCRQNHGCITQVLLRMRRRASGEVVCLFPVVSSTFGRTSRERPFTIRFEAPDQPGVYDIDYVTCWEYRMEDAVRKSTERGKASQGTLAAFLVGEFVPRWLEQVVWLGQRRQGSLLSLLPPDLVRKVLRRCGDWREGCACAVCEAKWRGGVTREAQGALVG